MPTQPRHRYEPDYIVTPGEILEEHLEARGMSKVELATRCGRPTKTISEIIHGKAAITAETALQLGRVLDEAPSLWQNLEANYRLQLARQREANEFEDEAMWAKRFPVTELVKRGHIDKPESQSDLVEKILAFFGLGTVAGWHASFGTGQVAFRRSAAFVAAPETVAAWLRLGERDAAEITTQSFNEKAFKALLQEIRGWTRESFPAVEERLVEACAEVGVAVVLVPELPNTHLSGAARWLHKDKALIQLSLRYKTADHLWFSFFHEAAHILLHSKKNVFVDANGDDVDELEAEANDFASSTLIPSREFRAFVRRANFTDAAIRMFAKEIGVAPGIVVGRLQHEEQIPWSRGNKLKERLA